LRKIDIYSEKTVIYSEESIVEKPCVAGGGLKEKSGSKVNKRKRRRGSHSVSFVDRLVSQEGDSSENLKGGSILSGGLRVCTERRK